MRVQNKEVQQEHEDRLTFHSTDHEVNLPTCRVQQWISVQRFMPVHSALRRWTVNYNRDIKLFFIVIILLAGNAFRYRLYYSLF